MSIVISKSIAEKLASKHGVSKEDVEQCFDNHFDNKSGKFLEDTREEHFSDPPTKWFISENYFGRSLKIVCIQKNNDYIIRTAFSPNDEEVRIYTKYGKK